MKKLRLLIASASMLFLNGTAGAAVIATLNFTTPTGTVNSTDTIEVWGTLSLDLLSDPLTFDPNITPLAGLPTSLIPTEAEVWNNVTSSYDLIPFDSYLDTSELTGRFCSGNFTNVCSDGEYSISPNFGSGSWFDLSSFPLSLSPGESRDFLMYEFTPTDGDAAPNDYIFYNMYVGFIVNGEDVNGNSIDQSVTLASTCPTQDASCAFTRTVVVSAVPIPAALWLFGSGLMGLIGMARRKTV